MKINRTVYKTIHHALKLVKNEMPHNKTWDWLFQEYGLGTKTHKGYCYTPADRLKLRELIQKLTGLDPLVKDEQQLGTMTRIEASLTQKDEKALSEPVRHRYLEVRLGTGLKRDLGLNHPAIKYIGTEVNDLLALDLDRIWVIENRAVFMEFNAESIDANGIENHTSDLKMASVFRGDNKTTSKPLIEFLQQTQAKVFHFGDFDAKGLEIGLSLPNLEQMLLPDLDKVSAHELQSLSKSEAYYRQLPALDGLEKNNKLSRYIDFIRKYQIAVTQEHLMSRRIPLKLVPLDC